MSIVEHFSDAQFSKEIEKGVVLVDFFAMWCAPCRMLAPILEQVAEHYKGRARVAKVDIDQEQMTATQFEVTSVPTLILFKNGKEVNRIVGLRNFDDLKTFLDKAL
jgi:thioredoxin 1